jgi:hypothetical protein
MSQQDDTITKSDPSARCPDQFHFGRQRSPKILSRLLGCLLLIAAAARCQSGPTTNFFIEPNLADNSFVQPTHDFRRTIVSADDLKSKMRRGIIYLVDDFWPPNVPPTNRPIATVEYTTNEWPDVGTALRSFKWFGLYHSPPQVRIIQRKVIVQSEISRV